MLVPCVNIKVNCRAEYKYFMVTNPPILDFGYISKSFGADCGLYMSSPDVCKTTCRGLRTKKCYDSAPMGSPDAMEP
jgi:hypothetical protein